MMDGGFMKCMQQKETHLLGGLLSLPLRMGKHLDIVLFPKEGTRTGATMTVFIEKPLQCPSPDIEILEVGFFLAFSPNPFF